MLDTAPTANLLTAHFPELTPVLHTSGGSLYQLLEAFAVYTRQAASSGQLTLLQECFTVADKLLQLEDAQLAAAIASGYLHCLHLDGSAYGNQLARQLMPARLYQVYAHPHHCMLP